MKRYVVLILLLCAYATGFAQPPTTTPTPQEFKRSMLGDPTRLVLSCKDVIQSMAWWTRLGFSPTPGGSSRPDSALTLSDGQIVITLVKDPLPTPILMFASTNIRELKDSLDSLHVGVTYDVQGPTLGELRLKSPSGVHMAVRTATAENRIPTSGDSNIVCGKLTEISVSVSDFPLKKEQKYWETLEFTVRRAGVLPYPYAIMTDGFVNIGLHELRDIPSVGLSYFAADMKDRIERLRKSGVTFIQEIKDTNNVVEHVYLASPDGQLVMLFTGDQ